MSLITRCPACETLFRVVPDQLRISEGWVRCGQCDDIFDASLHLLQVSPEDGVPLSQQEALVAESVEMVTAESTPEAADFALDADLQDQPDELSVEQEPVLPDVVADEAARTLPEPTPDDHSPIDEVSSLPVGLPDAPHEVAVAAPLTVVLPGRAADADFDDLDADLIADDIDVSFLRDRKNSAYWRKPLIRNTLSLLALSLLLGLFGQIVFHERDRIVALEPGLKPWLLAFCGPLNCALSPLRQMESIVIDSASFSKIRGDAYRLTFTVKNTAITALAVPAIELTLTDSLDQPVVRRVFFPGELGAKSDALAAGSEWPASLAMTLKAGGTADRVAGYRLLAFYP